LGPDDAFGRIEGQARVKILGGNHECISDGGDLRGGANDRNIIQEGQEYGGRLGNWLQEGRDNGGEAQSKEEGTEGIALLYARLGVNAIPSWCCCEGQLCVGSITREKIREQMRKMRLQLLAD
jgi:hypothetical protein